MVFYLTGRQRMNVRLLLLLSRLCLWYLTARRRRSCTRCRIVRAACLLLRGRRLGCCLVRRALASHVECRDELESLWGVAQHVLEVFRSDIFGQSVCVCDDLLQAIFVQRQQLLQARHRPRFQCRSHGFANERRSCASCLVRCLRNFSKRFEHFASKLTLLINRHTTTFPLDNDALSQATARLRPTPRRRRRRDGVARRAASQVRDHVACRSV